MNHLTFDTDLLTAEEEVSLARAIEVGVLAREALTHEDPPGRASAAELRHLALVGGQSMGRFVSANLRLVTFVVSPIARRSSLDADDLFQEGVVGLIEAVRRFDHRRGLRFATFALPTIRARVQDAAATRCGEAGLPPSRARRWIQVKAERDRLAGELGREPGAAEIAERCGWPVAQVRDLLGYRPAARIGQVELLADEVAASDEATDVLPVRRLLRVLGAEERLILTRLYGLGAQGAASYPEVAGELGMSVSTVRRRELAALERLRDQHQLLDAA